MSTRYDEGRATRMGDAHSVLTLNRSPPSPPRMMAFIKEKNRPAYSIGGTGLILCYTPEVSVLQKIRSMIPETYPIGTEALPEVLDLLERAIRGEDVDDAQVVDRIHRLVHLICCA